MSSGTYSILLKKENTHDDPIYCCAWTNTNTTGNSNDPSKDFILTAGLDGFIKIWLLQNNKLDLVHTLKEHTMAIVSLAVSPDGHTIASTSLDSCLNIWDLVSGSRVRTVLSQAGESWRVIFSPDGTHLLTGNHTGTLLFYGIQDDKIEKVLDTRSKFVLSIAWSSDGAHIASGAVDGTVCIFDVAQGKLLHTIEGDQQVRSVAFSPNSKLLATASNDGNVRIYNVESASLKCSLQHKCWVVAVCFSKDGTRVATATADGSIRIAAVDGLAVLKTFKEHADMVWGVQFNAAGDKLVSVSTDKCINIYECPIPPRPKTKK